VDFSYSSPTFLTVPEPGDAAFAVTAIGALSALARRRR
jgi:MYXO-CTERM domain-containing protein